MIAPKIQVITATPAEVEAFQRAQGGMATAGPLPGFMPSELWGDYTPPQYLVKGILSPGELTVLFGQSGHFKSVLGIDLAMSIASREQFHGLRTRAGGVLYVAGEGHGGIKKRLRAWMLAHDISATSTQPAVFVTSQGCDLLGNPQQLRATVEATAAALGVPVDLIVIDTLAANFGAGDENVAGDMSSALANARQAANGAALLLIHHSGHSDQSRERGSSALIGAADYRLQATYDEISKLIELKWLKLKDDERPEPVVFAWTKVQLGWRDEDGELSSVVLERLEGASIPRGQDTSKLGKHQETALKVLRNLYARAQKNLVSDGRDPLEARILQSGWRTACIDQGISRQRFSDLIKDLPERRLVILDGVFVRLPEATE